jgi:tetratricopeptide (TPR) repeat protein
VTVGIPGAGIGGLFYLLSALWMPFREAWRILQGDSSSKSRRTVKRQVSIAVAVIVSMSVTVWLLARLVTIDPAITSISGMGARNDTHSELPRFLSYSALAVSFGTLATILTAVTLLRRIVRPKPFRPAVLNSNRSVRPSKSASTIRITLLTIVLVLRPALLQSAQTVNNDGVTQHLQKADAAFKDEDSATAEREYRAVLQFDAANSHAVFRLAQLLQRSNRSESERLYRTYIELEPDDIWGYLALAEFLGRQGRYDEGLKLSAEVVRKAPQERDAVLVQARLLARSDRRDRAIKTYERWLNSHPNDVEASREVSREYQHAGRQRSALIALQRVAGNKSDEETSQRLGLLSRVTAPAIEPLFAFSRDSDGNTKVRAVVSSDFAFGENTRLKLDVGHTQISDAAETRSFNDFTVTTQWRPRAAVDIDAGGGAVRTNPTTAGGVKFPAELIATTNVRARVTAPGNAARLDLRLNRRLMDATPTLLTNRVVRNEVQLRPDLALSRQFRVHGVGGAALIEGNGGRNHRYIVGAGPGWKPLHAMELSANLTQSSYDHASQAGYFAPKQLQSIEGATYIEVEHEPTLLVLDLGGGVERFKENGSGFGHWGPAFRGYALLSFQLQPGRELRFEIDSYNTHAGPVVVPTPGWKYGSVTTSFRWAIP